MSTKEGLFYSEDHEWVKKEGKIVVIGISDHAQSELGDVVFAELPEVDEEFDQFDNIGVLESVKAVSDIFTPLSGKIIEINEELLNAPEKINESPFDEGWLIKLEMSDESELDTLMDSEQYKAFIEGE